MEFGSHPAMGVLGWAKEDRQFSPVSRSMLRIETTHALRVRPIPATANLFAPSLCVSPVSGTLRAVQ
jgi:hypothetical protein